MKSITLFLFALIAIIAIVNGQSPNIVPLPQSLNYGSTSVSVNPAAFKIATTSSSTLLGVAIKRYQGLFFLFDGAVQTAPALTLNVQVASDNEDLYLGVDESYTIVANTGSLTLSANTVFGAMRGLETFAQLISYDPIGNAYSIPYTPIKIVDSPRFPWRGFMVDSARHFLPKNFILHIIDALGFNKFNVLHWHLVDAVSFSVQSTTYPNLTKAAYFPTAIYTHDDIEEVVAYAKTYGIRVIPEFDIPGHTGSWGVGYPELLASCPNYAANVNNLALNPSLPYTYNFLQNLFAEMTTVFPDEYFHVGGDEVVFGCWQEDPSIVQWMNNNNFNLVDVEQYFEDQLDTILGTLNRTKLMWNDPFQNGVNIKPGTLIQIWDSYSIVQQIVDAGFKALVSTTWYLDKQDPANNIHYEWQDTWRDFYAADPYNNITTNQDNIIGGEACMWAEQVHQLNWDVRVWPRSIAIAERLWSDQSVNNPVTALPRIEQYTCLLGNRGVASGPLMPDFCYMSNDFSGPLVKAIDPLPKHLIKKILGKN
ncbi:beta-N-acetylhexosaminidase [Cavenderia fasciculata]|uniref:Beta-hexosaminidase n=1 Tax=Cavenderia fasciculata TaxID=261658 RepID=F4Q7J1_CACFS|nr:beta-N-acetylhexosaminidase [Cavenderia fasciculata]EGG16373.1 beta-N-acetylhexosaminidase [Cavenderia fasciculata]|eukprot:XP_004354757.1 beta-N-acetylhexosaminidase [Cavenderia fasciculata]